MTIVTKAVEDVAGNPDFTVWRFGSDLSLASDDVTIKSSRVVSVIPDSVDGEAVVTVDLDPGTVGVEYRGITTIIEVPDSDEPQDLLELLDAGSFLAGGEGFTPSAAYRGSPVDDVTDDGDGGAEFWVLGESVGSVPMPGAVWSNLVGKPVFDVKDFGAVGDGVTDDVVALQAALDAASASATSDGQRVKVLIPPGIYNCGAILYPKSNTVIENQGHLKFTGGNNLGGFVFIQNQQNIEMFGGVWDSNFQGNDNTISFGFLDLNNPQGPAGPYNENIWIHDMLIQNSLADPTGFSNDPIGDPAYFGVAGGKGISIQNGNANIFINSVRIENCDQGLTIEGLAVDDWNKILGHDPVIDLPGYSYSIEISDVVISNAKYMGIYFSGQTTSTSVIGQVTGISLSNVELVDCGVGQTTEDTPRDLADLVGSITLNAASGISATNLRVRSTTGKMTVIRGSHRACYFDMQVFAAGELVDVVNSEPFVGYYPAETQSFYNAVKAYVVVVSDTFSGYLVNSHATYSALFGKYEFTAIDYGTGTASAIPVAQYATNLGDSVLEVTDLYTSEFTRIDKGSPVQSYTAVTDGDTTPSVAYGRTLLETGNTSATTITEFEDSVPGQAVTIVFRDNNTTVAQTSGGGTIRLSGPAGDRKFIDRQTLTLVRSDSFWYEVSATFSIASFAGLNFPEVPPQSSADLTIAVAGVILGDCIALGMPVASQDATVVYTAWVSSADTVTVRCCNFGTLARNPGYGVFNVAVVR